MKIIGIDIGTSNTYIYVSRATPEADRREPPSPLLLPRIGDSTGSVATAVMYEDDKPYLIGNVAESEFYANLDARPRRRLASQFKPEIAGGDPGAMRAMTDFLRMLRQSLPDDFFDEGVEIYAGMPSLSREDYKVNLNACFREAGWPDANFARESDAALVSCLQSGVIEINDLDQKCLILDFGGGTCDYTTLENTEVLQNGGDLLYGGRLFDDLFFQIFCRADPLFAREVPNSPYEWYVHWVECKRRKEAFSDHCRLPGDAAATLHAVWYDRGGNRRESYVRAYTKEDFIRDAENYKASPQTLEILAQYRDRGGLSAQARDVLSGRNVGLLAWMRSMLQSVNPKNALRKAILTGGSCRWFFVADIISEVFPNAACIRSVRGFEDIAYGLALYPLLIESREKTQKLLRESLDGFSRKVVAAAWEIARKQTDDLARLCADRIVETDVMPTLELAAQEGMSIEEIERRCAENIANDDQLLAITERVSERLREQAGKELDFALKKWLRENGVLLAPNFSFPARAISREFFENASVKLSRLDALNVMRITITQVLPAITAAAAAGAIIHSGEAVSTVVGGSLAFAATWALAKTAPSFLERRKLPKFLLTEKTRRKIAEKNRYYLEKELTESLKDVRARMESEIEKRLKSALDDMLTKLSVLNQVKIS